MRQITAFLFVLSGERKETRRLEGRMRPGSAGRKTWHDGDGVGLPILTADQVLNCTRAPQ